MDNGYRWACCVALALIGQGHTRSSSEPVSECIVECQGMVHAVRIVSKGDVTACTLTSGLLCYILHSESSSQLAGISAELLSAAYLLVLGQ